MPAPNVDSCVIRLNIKKETELEISDEAFFFKVVRGAFSQRRKNICNSISSALGLPKQTVAEAVAAAGISETARAEQLKMTDFAAIAEKLLRNN